RELESRSARSSTTAGAGLPSFTSANASVSRFMGVVCPSRGQVVDRTRVANKARERALIFLAMIVSGLHRVTTAFPHAKPSFRFEIDAPANAARVRLRLC